MKPHGATAHGPVRARRPGARHTLALAAAIAVAGTLTAPVAAAAPGDGTRQGSTARPAAQPEDFDGDGLRDVAVTAPRAWAGGSYRAGYVAVLYGSRSGPLTGHRQILHQDIDGIAGAAEPYDWFGTSVTSADLDSDGYTDLLVGAAREDIRQTRDAGALYVVWGSPQGLAGSAVLRDGTTEGGELGDQVVAGDFDGDGDQDVASVEADEVRVLSGPFTRTGAATSAATVPGVPDTEIRDLAAGDVDGDGRTDIAATWYGNGDVDAAGTTGLLLGTAQGPGPMTAVGTERQGGDNVEIGDIDRDGYGDLVIGRSLDGNEGAPTIPTAKGGMVTFVPGSARGPVLARTRSLDQDSPGVPGTAEWGDAFGRGLSVGDTDGDRYPDVSVGVPGEDIGPVKDAGSVVVLRGTRNGPTGAGAMSVGQDTRGVPGTAERGDGFGSATDLTDTDGDGRAGLIASAVYENAGNGSVWVLRSTAAGITPSGAYTFGAGTLGMRAAGAWLGRTVND
ncbi:FG-GAP-like repeat-containing protein [Streptomyces yaizuensis]|uniref:VCBS repeat-containing protein n=1 Tax=Streptomyces yaizuensis TaxID=2989713 RepID=A0ABQ5NT92_9ACTN|nr:FG-GAP-like repeat-containing protein [Streptomyces sp. YSPA8]GLF93399.1 VCBS repeat-containing protein [Streptomyces sp. YSPA8]